jgi:hypothetical protein
MSVVLRLVELMLQWFGRYFMSTSWTLHGATTFSRMTLSKKGLNWDTQHNITLYRIILFYVMLSAVMLLSLFQMSWRPLHIKLSYGNVDF